MTTFKIHDETMQLKTWAVLARTIRSKSPYMDRTGLRQSRRVSGMMTHSQEIKNYGQVFIYMQKGIKTAVPDIRKIVKSVYAIQGMERKFRLYLAAFGDSDIMAHPRPYNIYNYKRSILSVVENLVEQDNDHPPYLLNTLDINSCLNRSMRTKINKNDLVLIIVAEFDAVHFSESVMETLSAHRNSYILCVDQEIQGKTIEKFNFYEQRTKSMSFLQKEISPILTEIRIMMKPDDQCNFSANQFAQIASKVNDFKANIEAKLNELNGNDDLRIVDGKKGGVLMGPVQSRKKYEYKSGSADFCLLCHKNYLIHGNKGKTPSEVPYMRALFNDRSLSPYNLIAYETPLMRKKNKHTTKGISGREVSCDLLGINDNELCCIEVKTVPDSTGTIVPYALLEGFAYAVCLQWILNNRKQDLIDEIKYCNDRINFNQPINPAKVTFAIAGPDKDYFRPYIEKKIANKKHSKEWFRRRMCETKVLENIPMINKMFAGYFVLCSSVGDIKSKKTMKDVIKPFFSKPTKITKKERQLHQIS
jgi:hypothetical protein